MKPLNRCCLVLLTLSVLCTGKVTAQSPKTFHDYVQQARTYFEQQKFPEALAAIQEAGKLEPTNYRAPALAATIFFQGRQLDKAKQSIDEALRLATPDGKGKLEQLAKAIDQAIAQAATTPDSQVAKTGQTEATVLSGTARRKYDTLLVIVEEADQAKSAAERRKLLDELLFKSGEFVREFPNVLQVWLLRAAAGLELEQERLTWDASSEMIRLGAENSDDPRIRQLLAKLDRKGWLKTPQELASINDEEIELRNRFANGFQNTLGMKFVPVPGTEVLFSVWETRKRDYAAYARANGGVYGSWVNPAFKGEPVTPTDDHPVVAVSWNDARAFCEWVTKKEQGEGKLPPGMYYRLPTDAEWSHAVGIGGKESGGSPQDKDAKVAGVYPWGTQWPSPNNSGNYADITAKARFTEWTVIEGYRDGFATAAPVGSFAANQSGLHDLGGNVWEWCEDWYNAEQKTRVLRGGSWFVDVPRRLLSSYRYYDAPVIRGSGMGFRVVLVDVAVR